MLKSYRVERHTSQPHTMSILSTIAVMMTLEDTFDVTSPFPLYGTMH